MFYKVLASSIYNVRFVFLNQPMRIGFLLKIAVHLSAINFCLIPALAFAIHLFQKTFSKRKKYRNMFLGKKRPNKKT